MTHRTLRVPAPGGAVLAAQFPPLVKNGLGADQTVATLFLATFSVGVAIGSVFVNWLLSPAGQEAANGGGSVSILDDVPGTVAEPAVLNPNRLEVLTDEYKAAFVTAFDEIFVR